MKFNVNKRKVTHIEANNASCPYLMNNQLRDEVIMHKDLGITVSSNLKVAEHCLQA